MAYQFQIIQALTWFGGFSTGIMADTLPIGEGWEWNQEFFDLVEKGIPHEEAYALWTARIEKEEGEFDPMKHSPFRASQNSKKTFAVVEATQDANEWLVENQEFVETFGLSSSFFMPRKIDSEDDRYSAEAKIEQFFMAFVIKGLLLSSFRNLTSRWHTQNIWRNDDVILKKSC